MKNTLNIYVLGFLLVMPACTPLGLMESAGDDATRVVALQESLMKNPNNIEARRDLGIALMRMQQFDQAESHLQQAYDQQPDDPETVLYYGLFQEQAGDLKTALHIYQGYTNLPKRNRQRGIMAGRYRSLLRLMAQQSIAERLATETAYDRVPPNSVIVLPFTFQGGEDRYAPLGQGLSAMLTADLGLIAQLSVLEREHLQILLEELKWSQNDAIDRETAPRIGQILGTKYLIGGAYSVLEGNKLHLEVIVYDIRSGSEEHFVSIADPMDEVFVLEKDLVFRLVDEMNILVTETERNQIAHVPTNGLQALMAYGRGLLAEDSGQTEAAMISYQQALQLAPGFQVVSTQAEQLEGLQIAGTFNQALREGTVASQESQYGGIRTHDLLNARHTHTQGQMGRHPSGNRERHRSGGNKRKPAAEAGTANGGMLKPPAPKGN